MAAKSSGRAKQKSPPTFAFDKRYIWPLVLALLLLYAIVPQVGSFKASLGTIRSADKTFIAAAAVFVVLSYFVAAATYMFLAYFRLRYWRTALIMVADGFTNRLLPAGTGGLATNALYLIKQNHGQVKAGYLAGINNLMGLAGHLILLVVLFSINPIPISKLFAVEPSPKVLTIIVAIAIICAMTFVYWRGLRHITRQAIIYAGELAASLVRHPLKLAAAQASAIAVTVCYWLCLYACMLALNIHLSALQVFLVLTAKVVSVTITPTPGGLGGAEAAIVASLIAFGISAQQSLSIALVFRFLTYWLPIIPGLFAFRYALKRNYLKLS